MQIERTYHVTFRRDGCPPDVSYKVTAAGWSKAARQGCDALAVEFPRLSTFYRLIKLEEVNDASRR